MSAPPKVPPVNVLKFDGTSTPSAVLSRFSAPAGANHQRAQNAGLNATIPPIAVILPAEVKPPPSAAAQPSQGTSTAPVAPAATQVVQTAPASSSSVAIIRTLSLVLKLSISGAILLAGAYFTMKSVVPVINELMHPGRTNSLHDKDAPAFVKAIRQTREVVAKNDANVAYLDSLVGKDPKGAANPFATTETPAQEPAPLPVAVKVPPPPPAPVKVTTYAPSAPVIVEVRSSSAPISDAKLRPYNNAIADLHIGGVMGGRSPRILVDGLLVRKGEIADARLKLKFTGVDQAKHVIFFTNEENVTFLRHY